MPTRCFLTKRKRRCTTSLGRQASTRVATRALPVAPVDGKILDSKTLAGFRVAAGVSISAIPVAAIRSLDLRILTRLRRSAARLVDRIRLEAWADLVDIQDLAPMRILTFSRAKVSRDPVATAAALRYAPRKSRASPRRWSTTFQ